LLRTLPPIAPHVPEQGTYLVVEDFGPQDRASLIRDLSPVSKALGEGQELEARGDAAPVLNTPALFYVSFRVAC
jgi:hypothetical protein